VVVGPPAVVGSFSYRSGDRHWNGGTWRRSSAQPGSTSRSSTVASANPRSGRSTGANRGSSSRQQANARERDSRRVASRIAPSDHGS
jgi:hypothetical protein